MSAEKCKQVPEHASLGRLGCSFLWSWTRGFACEGNCGNAVDNSRIGGNRRDFGEAATVSFPGTELRGQETFDTVPGNGNACRQTAEAKDVHIVILHALSS